MTKGVKGWLGRGKTFMKGKTSGKRRGIRQRNDDKKAYRVGKEAKEEIKRL